jgi:hypothetical protein
MGVELVKAAVSRHGSLPAKQYKTLIRMCLSAFDKPGDPDNPERVYKGGWEPLALAMGYDPTDPGKRTWIRKEVTQTCRALKDQGVIKPLVDNPGAGTRQYWYIEPMVGG